MLGFLSNTVYVRVKSDRISALHIETRAVFSDIPLLAYRKSNGKIKFLAIGSEAAIMAGQADVFLDNGFKHPRTPISDFAVAEETLKQLFKKLFAGTLFTPSPVVIIHPMEDFEGGLTQIEIRALAELAFGAGARRAYVWQGPELTEDELKDLRFSQVGGQLLYP